MRDLSNVDRRSAKHTWHRRRTPAQQVRDVAGAFIAEPFAALTDERVLPTSRHNLHIRVGRDYFGDTVRNVPCGHGQPRRPVAGRFRDCASSSAVRQSPPVLQYFGAVYRFEPLQNAVERTAAATGCIGTSGHGRDGRGRVCAEGGPSGGSDRDRARTLGGSCLGRILPRASWFGLSATRRVAALCQLASSAWRLRWQGAHLSWSWLVWVWWVSRKGGLWS